MKRFTPISRLQANSGIRPLYEIDSAAWIWHPDLTSEQPAFLTFRRHFDAPEEPLVVHISADQRYELYLDGKRVARGPDRSDVQHWSFATYRFDLEPGSHSLQAFVWWLGEHAPQALMTHRGGFILKAEAAYDKMLTTGTARWEVRAHAGWEMKHIPMGHAYHVIGDAQIIDGKDWFGDGDNWKVAATIKEPVFPSDTGVVVSPGWKLYPSNLPDQIDRDIVPGRIRAIGVGEWSEARVFAAQDCRKPDVATWQELIKNGKPVVVPKRTKITVLWDLEDYYCAYAELTTSGGACSRVEWLWAESLFESDFQHKGNRSQVEGKHFRGFGHTSLPDGGNDRTFRSYWWCSGRFSLITIRTGDEPLTIQKLSLNETRYPLENVGEFRCTDTGLNAVIDISTRAMQMCSHETYMDCPYYEQMMYVADSRIEMLIHYVMEQDDRLQKRSIDLFSNAVITKVITSHGGSSASQQNATQPDSHSSAGPSHSSGY